MFPNIRRRYLAAIAVFAAAISLSRLSSSGSASPSVQEYYTNLESQLGYWILLGNARHCGLWEKDTVWPFPIGKAQRAMEEKLYTRLGLANDSMVLDAGAGSGIVAAYMAEHGLRVQGIDLTPLHVEQATRNIASRGLADRVSVRLGDYHDRTGLLESSFDGVYTMETFVHADDPAKVLRNFWHVLKPGGVLVLHEADFQWDLEVMRDVLRLSHCQNMLKEGFYEEMLLEAGFGNVTVEDLTDEVLPLWRLFGVLGAVPYEILRLLGLQHRFINVMAGVETYRNWGQARYISVRATRPY